VSLDESEGHFDRSFNQSPIKLNEIKPSNTELKDKNVIITKMSSEIQSLKMRIQEMYKKHKL
jgi:hypothetical protein